MFFGIKCASISCNGKIYPCVIYINQQGIVMRYNKINSLVKWIMVGAAIFAVQILPGDAKSSSPRLKDIINVEGIRDNILVGYGLVVGLNGTGDKLNNTPYTEKSLAAFLDRLGVNTRNQKLGAKNVAAVSVTATLPPFARPGSKIDVSVSAMGDAKSLEGGMLIATPLVGADGEAYAVAQGSVSIGGFMAAGSSNTITKGNPTTAYISNGAIVEKEVDFRLDDLTEIKLALKNPDLSTAKLVQDAINQKLNMDAARATDPSTIQLIVPEERWGQVANLLAEIEQLEVSTDIPAKIVIDEENGTIVFNKNVKLDNVAVAQGNLVVTIFKTPVISQPLPLAPEGAETIYTTSESLKVEESKGNIANIAEAATLKDLVDGLNQLGVSPRDLISILQSVKVAGALQADIESK
jgi:flagellar P-ring protein precursor FlgI